MHLEMRHVLRGLVTALGVLSAAAVGGQPPEGSRLEQSRDVRKQLAALEKKQHEALERFQRERSAAHSDEERDRLDGRYQAEVRQVINEALALAGTDPASSG